MSGKDRWGGEGTKEKDVKRNSKSRMSVEVQQNISKEINDEDVK